MLALFILVFAGLLVLYGWNDPATSKYFLKCPFKLLTGLDCPGCGSQRAVHNLLHLNIGRAFMCNALFVVAIPYIFGAFYFDCRKSMSPRQLLWRRRLYGVNAIYIILALIVVFTIVRNVF